VPVRDLPFCPLVRAGCTAHDPLDANFRPGAALARLGLLRQLPTAGLAWQDRLMQPEVIVGLTSAGVAALAIATSSVTTVLSLKVQRENTNSTLETQRMLAAAQENFTRERSHAQEMLRQRIPLYGYLPRWAESLLEGLHDMNSEHPELAKARWHIEPEMEDSIDLYAPDAIHIRFNALRGLLIGLVKDSGFSESPFVTWDEQDGRISNVSITSTPPLIDWETREPIREKARKDALRFIHTIRAEVQGPDHSGWFVTYHLSR
jgi:hypothetical protein